MLVAEETAPESPEHKATEWSPIPGLDADQYQERFKKVKKAFKKQRTAFYEQAKTALEEAAKIYLGDKAIESYKKYRQEISTQTLGQILYQMHTMEEALHIMSAKLKVAGGYASPRDVEVFSQLNRVILDAQKFQFEFLKSIEDSMKLLRDEVSGGTDQPDTEEAVVYMKGNKELIRTLMEARKEVMEFTPSLSKNPRINPLTQGEETTYEVIDEVSLKDAAKLFKPYENEPVKKKKEAEREFDDDESVKDDFDI